MKLKEKLIAVLLIVFPYYIYLSVVITDNKPLCVPACSNYAVMAVRNTTNVVPESVRRFMYVIHEQPGWCFVAVVADSIFHSFTLHSSWALYRNVKDKFIALSIEDETSTNERKNYGYQYAILNGAEVIFDLCEDCNLKFWLKGAVKDVNLQLEHYVHSDKGNETLSIFIRLYTQLFTPKMNRTF